jgi:RNA polymerase sigma factor (sigma-70 family)
MSFALSVTPRSPACSEHELVAAVRQGDERAFEELYSRYRSRIGSYVYGMVGDHGRAEDIVQEVFISALRRLRDTERPIAFKPWIYEIAKNACIDEFRRTRRTKEVPLDGDDEPGGAAVAKLHSAPAPEVAIESKQQLTDLRGAFRGLSESHHKIIVMRELEGLSYTEIGERMEMSRAMVESTLFRARRRLSEEYEELVSGRRCSEVQTVIACSEGQPVKRMGVRTRRQLARHLSHCEACRRHARISGFDDSLLKGPGVIGKVAALLPFPWLRWRRGGGQGRGLAAGSSHPLAALQSLMTLGDPTGPFSGLGRAVAAAAALALAGGGGVVAANAISSSGSQHPAKTLATQHVAGPSHSGGSSSGSAASSAAASSSALGKLVATVNGHSGGADKAGTAKGGKSAHVGAPGGTSTSSNAPTKTAPSSGSGSSSNGTILPLPNSTPSVPSQTLPGQSGSASGNSAGLSPLNKVTNGVTSGLKQLTGSSGSPSGSNSGSSTPSQSGTSQSGSPSQGNNPIGKIVSGVLGGIGGK